eukprot:5680970-Pleurochrysis_carterae.AAC.1
MSAISSGFAASSRVSMLLRLTTGVAFAVCSGGSGAGGGGSDSSGCGAVADGALSRSLPSGAT